MHRLFSPGNRNRLPPRHTEKRNLTFLQNTQFGPIPDRARLDPVDVPTRPDLAVQPSHFTRSQSSFMIAVRLLFYILDSGAVPRLPSLAEDAD